MGFFARVWRVIKSWLFFWVKKAEDPEKMLDVAVDEMYQQLRLAKQQISAAVADEKRLKKQTEEEFENVQLWHDRAMKAVNAENDELAKEALVRKKEHQRRASEFETQWETQKKACDDLKVNLRTLNSKIEEAKRKKDLLIAKKKRAEAQKGIHETMAGLKDGSAFDTFNNMESKIDQMVAESEAAAEMADEATGDTLANKFEQLDASVGMDDDLDALKQEMGIKQRVEDNSPEEADVEAELETMKQEEQKQVVN